MSTKSIAGRSGTLKKVGLNSKKRLTFRRSSAILNSCSPMSRRPSHIARKRILAAALHVFGANGYKEATVREIARTAGVSIGALYPYFGNKEQLFLEVLLEETGQFNERIRDLEHQEPEPAVESFIETHLAYAASKRQIVSRHFKDYDLEFVKPIRNRFWTYQKEFLEAIIRKGAELGVFRVGNPGDAALFVLWVLKGALFYDLAGVADLTRSGDTVCQLSLSFLRDATTGEPGAARRHPSLRTGDSPSSQPILSGTQCEADRHAGGDRRA